MRKPRPMDGAELRRALSYLGLPITEFAGIMGVHVNTVSRWVNDHHPTPQAIAILVRRMVAEERKAKRTKKRVA